MDIKPSPFFGTVPTLKTCPFCGTMPTLKTESIKGYEPYVRYVIKCDKCGCQINYAKDNTVYYSTQEVIEHMINKWNKRVEVK